MNKAALIASLAAVWLLSATSSAAALTFTIRPGSDVVGNVQTATVMSGESFNDIGRKFDVGIYELIEANPSVDPYEPNAGTMLVIPSQFVLPRGTRKGIIINLAEMRIYYFHKDGVHVTTHPIGIGRPEWETPLGSGKILEKTKNPSWRPPASIRAWYDERDKYLPDIVPPGPLNPLGKFALRLSIPGYLIHGTNMDGGIGIRSSSGCIRMHPEDIESLFYKVSIGDPVRIVHQPIKVGKLNGQLYIEAHEPLSGQYYNRQSEYEILEQAMEEAAVAGGRAKRELAERAIERSSGYPTLIQ